jgi:hypothetical protein
MNEKQQLAISRSFDGREIAAAHKHEIQFFLHAFLFTIFQTVKLILT